MAEWKKNSKDRWLQEAKEIIIKKGVQEVKIDVLSEKIGVAKTSFYHFYTTKENFMDLVFRSGIADGTDKVMMKIGKIKDPVERIERLKYIIIGPNLNNELFLRRLRTYGMHNKKIARLIKDTENIRINFLKGLLMDTGVPEDEAFMRAEFFYIYSIGLIETIYTNPERLNDMDKIYRDLGRMLNLKNQ